MELPPYRMPTLKASMMIHTWAKGKQYLKKMGEASFSLPAL